MGDDACDYSDNRNSFFSIHLAYFVHLSEIKRIL